MSFTMKIFSGVILGCPMWVCESDFDWIDVVNI